MSGKVVHFEIPDLHYSIAQTGPTGEGGWPTDVGEMGRAAYFKDVEGNLMGLWQSRQACSGTRRPAGRSTVGPLG